MQLVDSMIQTYYFLSHDSSSNLCAKAPLLTIYYLMFQKQKQYTISKLRQYIRIFLYMLDCQIITDIHLL
jgi:hypothetical protein